MYVFCCGMHRSASTWQYMVASDLVEKKKGGQRLGVVNKQQEYLKHDYHNANKALWQTMKMHTARPAFGSALEDGRAVALYSYRDIRDVVFSLMQMHNVAFEKFAQRGSIHDLIENDRYWRKQPRTLIQRYNEITQNSTEAVRQIATILEVQLTASEVDAIVAENSVEANQKRAQAVEAEQGKWWKFWKSRSFDSHTLLHWNHISRKKVTWRSATPEQLKTLAAICGPWLIQYKFEVDDSWAKAPQTREGLQYSF